MSPTKSYRVYCLDNGQHMVSVDWIEAVSDEEAITKAEAQGFGSKCEIWEGRRLVAQLQEALRSA